MLTLTLTPSLAVTLTSLTTQGLYRTTGSVAVKPGAKAPVLQLDAEECRLGPLPVPLMTRTSTERLLFLDSTMCVAEASSGDLTVLVRPKLRVDPDDGE